MKIVAQRGDQLPARAHRAAIVDAGTRKKPRGPAVLKDAVLIFGEVTEQPRAGSPSQGSGDRTVQTQSDAAGADRPQIGGGAAFARPVPRAGQRQLESCIVAWRDGH